MPLQFLFLGPYINAQGLFWHVVHFVHGRRHSAVYGMLKFSQNLHFNLKSSKDVGRILGRGGIQVGCPKKNQIRGKSMIPFHQGETILFRSSNKLPFLGIFLS